MSWNPYTVDLSSLNPFPHEIIAVIYDTNTPVNMLSQDEIENAGQLTSVNANSVFGSWDGVSLQLFFGDNVTVTTSGSITLVYIRQPNTAIATVANASSKYLDVLDEDMEEVVNIASLNASYYRN